MEQILTLGESVQSYWTGFDGITCAACEKRLTDFVDTFTIDFDIRELKYCPFCGAKMIDNEVCCND